MVTIVNRNVFCYDIDDTVVIHDAMTRDLKADTTGRLIVICPYEGTPYSFEVHQRHVDFIKREKAKGSYVIAWSRSEAPWAQAVVKALGLEAHTDLCMSKPVKILDDKSDVANIVGTVLYFDKNGFAI